MCPCSNDFIQTNQKQLVTRRSDVPKLVLRRFNRLSTQYTRKTSGNVFKIIVRYNRIESGKRNPFNVCIGLYEKLGFDTEEFT